MRRRQAAEPEFVQGLRRAQSNTTWPGPVVNGRAVDAFLWRGSPRPSRVQRVGAWIFGFTYILGGVGLALTYSGHPPLEIKLLVCLSVLLGARIFGNGFSRKRS